MDDMQTKGELGCFGLTERWALTIGAITEKGVAIKMQRDKPYLTAQCTSSTHGTPQQDSAALQHSMALVATYHL